MNLQTEERQEDRHPLEADTYTDIDQALVRGDIDGAKRLARGRPHEPQPPEHKHVDAQLTLRLAYCQLAESRPKAAAELASRAGAIFRERSDLQGEVAAQALMAQSAIQQGQAVEAVEAGMLSTRLAAQIPHGWATAQAQLALGMAYGWGNAYDLSFQAFDSADQLVDSLGDPAARLETLVERLWILALRRANDRSTEDHQPRFDGLERLQPLLEAWSHAPRGSSLIPGIGPIGLRLSAELVSALLLLWSGRVDEARLRTAESVANSSGTGASAWLMAAQSWLSAELALHDRDVDAALMHADRMSAIALQVEHFHLAGVASRLAAGIYLQKGEPASASAQLIALLTRGQGIQVQLLESRRDATDAELAVRDGRRQLADLTVQAAKFEKWAFEDAVTGIANVRRFNQCVADWTTAAAEAERPLSVALIDVDKFKRINDDFSYDTGNQVLRVIAGEIAKHVREHDLPARWGGDEFVILFRDASRATAQQVAGRIQQAVAHHDWTSIAENLSVAISVGVTEAHVGDDKKTLVARSEAAMFHQKMERRRADIEKLIPPRIVRSVASWLRRAKRVVVLVGAGAREGLPSDDRAEFGQVIGLRTHQSEFQDFWMNWRREQRSRPAIPMHEALVALSHRLQHVTFVTERVDGLLGKAGANDVVELYGNAFRDRCGACSKLRSNSGGFCLACKSPWPTIRPDIVLESEHVDGRLLAGTELAFKRADVVLVVDWDARTSPAASLIEKARVRAARVVILEGVTRSSASLTDLTVKAPAEVFAKVLADALDAPAQLELDVELSADGFAVYLFLSGQGADNAGVTLEQALGWKDWEVQRHLGTIPWMFPLPTPSQMNPASPTPSDDDYRLLAGDEGVRDGFRRCFHLMLRFYGFQWRENRVERALNWRVGFANWALSPGPHDLFISRILGAMKRGGLRDEATKFLEVLELEGCQFRAESLHGALWHWRLAVAAA